MVSTAISYQKAIKKENISEKTKLSCILETFSHTQPGNCTHNLKFKGIYFFLPPNLKNWWSSRVVKRLLGNLKHFLTELLLNKGKILRALWFIISCWNLVMYQAWTGQKQKTRQSLCPHGADILCQQTGCAQMNNQVISESNGHHKESRQGSGVDNDWCVLAGREEKDF